MRASVVVPTFNRRETVLRTIGSLLAQDLPPEEFEIIVVIDGSKDGTADAVRRLATRPHFQILEQENRGLAGARNTGWRAAAADLIIFLDDDMDCEPGLVRAHCEAQRAEGPSVGIGAIYLSNDSPKTLAAECFKREVGEYALLYRDQPGAVLEARHCIFGNTSIRRNLLETSRGFDERFRMREDAELCFRLRRSGIQARFVRDAVAHQFYDKTVSDLLRDAENFAVADALLLQKHPDFEGETFLTRIAREPKWKHRLRGIAARNPALSDPFLSPFCWLGSRFPSAPLLRKLGVRSLQVQRGLHYYSTFLQL